MKPETVRLFSPYAPAECVSRLIAAIDPERFHPFSISSNFGTKPVIGYVTESSIRLRKRIRYANSWQRHLAAIIRPAAGGTTICGSISLHRAVRSFMLFWSGSCIFFEVVAVAVFAISVVSGKSSQNVWVIMVFAPVMLAFGFTFTRFGEFQSRNESRFLTDFLVQTLDAKEESEEVGLDRKD